MLSESQIQNILYRHLRWQLHHNYITNNIYFFSSNWESDLISVTQAGYIREYEIKISKADFKADKKKIWKHSRYKNGIGNIPSQFWYVISGFELELDEVPSYAGLMKVEEYKEWNTNLLKGFVTVLKQAPKLSTKIITPIQKEKIMNSLGSQYWNLRLRNLQKEKKC